MGNPWLPPSDNNNIRTNDFSQIQHQIGGILLNEIASNQPSPSDRLAAQRRAAAAGQTNNGTPFDNIGAPATPGAHTGLGSNFQNFSAQFKPQPPVLNGNPNYHAPTYGGAGPNSPDAPVVGQIVSNVPGGALAWEAFKRTYTDRSNENVLPSQLQLREAAPNVVNQVSKWMLLTDSDLSQPRRDFNNRDFRPTPNTNPGHVYAIGLGRDGNPINVLEYYWGDHNMTYSGQYLINYGRDNQGNMHSRISHYVSSDQTAQPGPHVSIGDSNDVLEGTAEFVSANNGQILSMKHYCAFNTATPDLQFDLGPNSVQEKWTDANGGYQQRSYSGAMAAQIVRSQAPKFYFSHLFGP